MREGIDYVLYGVGIIIIAVLLLMIAIFSFEAYPVLSREGLAFFLGGVWNPGEAAGAEKYQIGYALLGTIYTSSIAIVISLPTAIAVSLFITDIIPSPLRRAFENLLFLMALMPTVLYGLWGSRYLAPFLLRHVMEPLHGIAPWFPLFSYEPRSGESVLTAGVLLAIMIMPYQAALIKGAYSSIPSTYREALYSLGATYHEAALNLLKMIKSSILVATILGLGRAMGETVAVSMVVGNVMRASASPFSPGYTISSLIANQFGNSFLYHLMPSAFYASGLTLMAITLAVSYLGLSLGRRWGVTWRI